MYTRYAETMRWRVKSGIQPHGLGGLKEVIATIIGKGAYSHFKYESGVHRVQRVPKTEVPGAFILGRDGGGATEAEI